MAGRKQFVWGMIAGFACAVCLAIIGMQVLGIRWEHDIASLVLLRTGQRQPAAVSSNLGLPHPWLPESTGQVHDSWRIRPLDGGKSITLAALKGEPVFLNIWSTTCMPCIGELPTIERLHSSLKNQHVAFLAVTRDHAWEVRNFLKKNHINLPVYLSEQDPPSDLPASIVPTTYILDSNGAAVFKYVGALNWDDTDARRFLNSLTQPRNSLQAYSRNPN